MIDMIMNPIIIDDGGKWETAESTNVTSDAVFFNVTHEPTWGVVVGAGSLSIGNTEYIVGASLFNGTVRAYSLLTDTGKTYEYDETSTITYVEGRLAVNKTQYAPFCTDEGYSYVLIYY